jgi:DNA polymerase
VITLTVPSTFSGWRPVARKALQRAIPPEEILWEEAGGDARLFDLLTLESASPSPDTVRVPPAFMEVAKRVACHRAPTRWAILYRVLWRITHGEPHLLDVFVDPDVHPLVTMDKAVRRDVHKMRAFVRFREVAQGGVWLVAWFEPEHLIVELNASFFVDRFAGMRWSILTPDRCAHWDGAQLTFSPGVDRSTAPAGDVVEELWRTYYAHIFNPARIKLRAMQAEMPRHYWKNLPEAALIPELLRDAPGRVSEMIARSVAKSAPSESREPVMPESADWETLREAASACQACPLYKNATQTVFGEGPRSARIVLLGEQPGDQEDIQGRPFVGPAGQLLDRALIEAGIERKECYVTNSVKHFKWEPRGKRRIHERPNKSEIGACKPWWKAELTLVRPSVLICLGATAAQAVFEREVRVLSERGTLVETAYAQKTLITIHPSSLLRIADPEQREREYRRFVEELAKVV